MPSHERETIAGIRRLRREIRARTRRGEFQGDSDTFELDRRLMEAELRWPRSTLPLYLEQYRPVWLIGVVLLVLGLVALTIIDNAAFGVVAVGLGAVLALGPVAAWYESRPRVSGRGNGP